MYFFRTISVKNSVVSNGCLIEGTVENSVIGRGCVVKKGAVVRNSVILPGASIGKDITVENYVVDKNSSIRHVSNLIGTPENPGYIKRGDTILITKISGMLHASPFFIS